MKPRVAPYRAAQVGRGFTASPDRLSARRCAIVSGTIVIVGLQATGVSFDGQIWTIAACFALLVFGIPHGSLDIATLAGARCRSVGWLVSVITLYLGCAAAMYLVWAGAPIIALSLFFIMAAVHFAEDWQDDLPPFLAIGTAIAMLTAPTFFFRTDLVSIFMCLTGSQTSASLADAALMVAPVALVVAAAGLLLAPSRDRAIETLAGLSGMIFLPPIIGFALYFCLSHSPRHLAVAARATDKGLFGYRRIEMTAVTLAALAIAALVYAGTSPISVSEGGIAASFITLSILTVPHMLVPMIVAKFERQTGRSTA